mmetsp:Transcript_1120/g.3206  ORF Transcript_1120/g.3206 Transcript_1120/m.3206 type:complete len:269 (+) Transcript_1120:126-932(+)
MRPLKMPVPLAPGPAPAGRAGSNRWALLAAGRLLLGGQAREAGLAGKGLVGHGGRARLCRLLRLWTRVHALQKGAKEGVDSLGVLLHELVRRGPHRVHLGRGAGGEERVELRGALGRHERVVLARDQQARHLRPDALYLLLARRRELPVVRLAHEHIVGGVDSRRQPEQVAPRGRLAGARVRVQCERLEAGGEAGLHQAEHEGWQVEDARNARRLGEGAHQAEPVDWRAGRRRGEARRCDSECQAATGRVRDNHHRPSRHRDAGQHRS